MGNKAMRRMRRGSDAYGHQWKRAPYKKPVKLNWRQRLFATMWQTAIGRLLLRGWYKLRFKLLFTKLRVLRLWSEFVHLVKGDKGYATTHNPPKKRRSTRGMSRREVRHLRKRQRHARK